MAKLFTYEGKAVEILDVLTSNTTDRAIAIVRQGLNTFPADVADIEPRIDVSAFKNQTAGTEPKRAEPSLTVRFEGDRANVDFIDAYGEAHRTYGFIREDSPGGMLQAVSYAVGVIKNRVDGRGWQDE